MNRTLTIATFLVLGALVTVLFVSSTSYVQLAVASLLYPPLIYMAFKLFPSGQGASIGETITLGVKQQPIHAGGHTRSQTKTVELVDFDRRAFLKLIGAAGFSFFIFSFLSRRVEDLFLKSSTSQNGLGGDTSSLPTEGYKVSEIDSGDDSYYGFINSQGAWYIMKEDSETGSFRYIKGPVDFAKNWENRSSLEYKYYHQVFN